MKHQAHELHRRSYVFDFSPLAEPFVPNEVEQAALDRAVSVGYPLQAVTTAMVRARSRAIATDERMAGLYQNSWNESGVNGVLLTLGGLGISVDSWESALNDAATWHERVSKGRDLAICRTAQELEQARAEGRVGLVFGLQDAAVIGRSLDRLELLHGFGLAVVQLTYNTRTFVGDGCTERNAGGLSRFGIALLERMRELSIVADVSHCSQPTLLDAIEHAGRPVAVTHASCAALCSHQRAKSDEVLRALAASGGYFGVVNVPLFLRDDGQATLQDFARHVAHAADVMGPDKVGIGTDWGIFSPDYPAGLVPAAKRRFVELGFAEHQLPDRHDWLPGIERWEDWPLLTEALLGHGMTETEVEGILGRNWLDFMRRAQPGRQ